MRYHLGWFRQPREPDGKPARHAGQRMEVTLARIFSLLAD
jgi:hypothetical protein